MHPFCHLDFQYLNEFYSMSKEALRRLSVCAPARCHSRPCLDGLKSNGMCRFSVPQSHKSAQWQTTRLLSNWSESVSKRDMADLENTVCGMIAKQVKDPLLVKPLSQLQWLHKRIGVSTHNDDSDKTILQFLLRLPSLLHPEMDQLKRLVQNEAEKHVASWLRRTGRSSLLENVNVNVEAIATKPASMMARLVEDRDELLSNLGPGLECVSHFVAVYSCKGGVGKSTVAVNVAYEMAAQGGRIGLLDLDLYGPSLPVLVTPEDITIRRSSLGNGMVHPIQHGNVKLLSLGFVNKNSGVPGSGPQNGAAVMKGPMAVKVVSQLLKGTDWGDLDVLILDLPPGTGDIQLAVLQNLQLSGAVAVSTPSRLSAVDTQKGIEMFTSLGVPTLAVVENMSYFEDEDGRQHFPFGKGLSANPMQESTKTNSLIKLPISMATNDANESGEPLALQRPKDATRELVAFRDISAAVSTKLLELQYGSPSGLEEIVVFGESSFIVGTLRLTLDKTLGSETFTVSLFSDSEATQETISPVHLRSRDPKTGELMQESPFARQIPELQQSDPMVTVTKSPGGKVSPTLVPMKVERRGRYGFAVEWADGATIIYSMRSLAQAAGGKIQTK